MLPERLSRLWQRFGNTFANFAAPVIHSQCCNNPEKPADAHPEKYIYPDSLKTRHKVFAKSREQDLSEVARRELALEGAIAKLDRYDLLILDDIAYVTKDQAETSVLFELIAARYERRSMLITANQPFGEWGKIFPDQAMTLAAIDRLVHHATILEMNVESYRRREALERKRGRGRPAAHATIKKGWFTLSAAMSRFGYRYSCPLGCLAASSGGISRVFEKLTGGKPRHGSLVEVLHFCKVHSVRHQTS